MLKPTAGRGHQPQGGKKKNYQKKRNNSHEYSSVCLWRVKDEATGTSVNASLYSALFSPTLPRGGRRRWVMITVDRASPSLRVCSGVRVPNGFGERIRLRFDASVQSDARLPLRDSTECTVIRMSASALCDTQVGSLLGHRISGLKCSSIVCRLIELEMFGFVLTF